MIVIGWKGTVHEGAVRGSVAQEVLRTADRDVVVVKDNGLPNRIDEILVGASPGFRARDTIDFAAELADGFDADLRVLTVTRPGQDLSDAEDFLGDVREHLSDRLPAGRVHTQTDAAADVADAFVDHSARTGLLAIGASRDWVLPRTLLGEFADDLANRVPRSIAMIRPYEATPVSIWRQAVGFLRRGGALH